MAFEVRIICDSISPHGKRLTTLTATYPRFIHSELMTHRCFARNAASSRAIPWEKMRQRIIDDPVIPLVFGSEKKGMQTGDEIEAAEIAKMHWISARNEALHYANRLADLEVHKSLVNRVVEPYMWITTLITATEWKNFFRLRCHSDAEIHFQKIAGMIRDAIEVSLPWELNPGQWHLPFITANDREELKLKGYQHDGLTEALCKISVARSARISYLTHDGVRDTDKDLDLFTRLANGSGFGHWSPHEHIATPAATADACSGPFRGWEQYRKRFPLENLEG